MLICVLIYTNASAQLNNSFFDIERTDTATGLITLHVDNLNYFRNVEYKTKIDEGRTLFGYQFWPEIAYQVSTHVQVAGGCFCNGTLVVKDLLKTNLRLVFNTRMEETRSDLVH